MNWIGIIIIGIICFVFLIFPISSVCGFSPEENKKIIYFFNFFKTYYNAEEIEKRKIFRKLISSLDDEDWIIDKKYSDFDTYTFIIFSLTRKEKLIESVSELRVSLKNNSKIIRMEAVIKITNPEKPIGQQIVNFNETTNNIFLFRKISKFVKKILKEELVKNNSSKIKDIKEVSYGIDFTFKSIKKNKRDSKIKNILKK